jgi:hypothetical protein
MILDRSWGADLSRQVEETTVLNRNNPIVVDRKIKRLLASGMSRGGLYFKNSFPKGVYFDASRNDVRKVITNLLRANRYNWHGYLRELKFINELAVPESPFILEESGGRQLIKDGRLVEFDLLTKHRSSGLKLVIESKDWKIRSKEDLEKAKKQIEKIAMRARQQGVSRVAWVNRKLVTPRYRSELLAHAERHGVGFYDNVSTSLKRSHDLVKPKRFDDVLELESSYLRKIRWGSLAGKSFVAASAVYEIGNGIYTVHKWQSGRITTREFVSTGSGAAGGLAGGIAGGFAGVKAGAAIGTLFGPGYGTAIGAAAGGLIGSVGGAIAGTAAGEFAGNTAAEKLVFQSLNEKEKRATYQALIQHYEQVRSP